jgi:hypothetical protein
VLDNGRVRIVVSADAGARAFIFEDLATKHNRFTTIGALRDDVASPPPISRRDYIGKYTHPFPTGTFNRSYHCIVENRAPLASLHCTYLARDLAATPVHFEKLFTLAPNATSFTVRVRASAAATSISALLPARAGTTKPYDLFTLNYPRDQARWITFSLQGPPAVSANPGGSP